MQRYYVRLNEHGQPIYLTRQDDPNHTPISSQTLPGRLKNLVVKIYGEFTNCPDALRGRQAFRGPVVIEWPERVL